MIDKNEILKRFNQLKKVGKIGTKDLNQLNKEFGKPYKDGESLRAVMNRAVRNGGNFNLNNSKKQSGKKSITINSEGTQTSNRLVRMNEEQSKDITFILKAHGYSPDEWEIISTTNSEWEVQKKGGSIESLYASKISVRPKQKLIDLEETYKKLLDLPIKHIPKEIKKVEGKPYLLEIPLQDLHIGKFSSLSDNGEIYNYQVAIKRAHKVVDDILSRASNKNIEKILFLLGGDMFHSDTVKYTTTAGTQMENDISWQDMYVEGVKLLTDLIGKMLEIAPVDVITIPGNHDTQTMVHAQLVLKAYYRNDTNVRIDTKLTYRKYYEYGDCLIGFTHGDKEASRLTGVMQVEVPEAWGRTKFREIHAGHLHKEKTDETTGIIIRNISSITGTDSWHTQKGFIGAQKKLQTFLWCKERGLLEIWNSPIILERVERTSNELTFGG